MSAELLRRAAALMRKRVSKTSAPDVDGWYAYLRSDESDGVVRTRIGNHTYAVAETDWPGDAEHIASWHPAVALAVADWLEQEADDLDSDPEASAYAEHDLVPCIQSALVVARAYLGESL